MAVQFPCLKCNRAVAKNHKAVQCDICDKWIHIACNNLNTYTYKKLQKDKSPWYCICCLQKELPYCSIGDDVLNSFMHGKRILSPNPKFISSVITQSEYFDEEILEKVNNKYYTPTEFNNALNELRTKKQNLYMHLNISSLSYHHLEIYNLISDMKIKLKIIGISESRLQKSKQHTTNISLPNYVYEHTPTESSKEGTLLYLDKNLKYKLRKDLNIYQKGMIESTFVEIINKNEKNMVSGCIYKHPKQTIPDFLDNHLLPLLSTHPLE